MQVAEVVSVGFLRQASGGNIRAGFGLGHEDLRKVGDRFWERHPSLFEGARAGIGQKFEQLVKYF
ncbi:hypothetical protein GCM10009077_42300 [Roseibium denhamense]